jgi:hypothetical protein
VREPFVAFVAFVVVDLYTIIVEYRLLSPAVFKTMQMDLYASPVQGPDLMEQIEYASVIYRVWHVQAHDM